MRNDASHASEAFAVVEIEETDSTNSEALRRSAGGTAGPLWIVARRQTAGRGRRGRAWLAPEGNLAASLLFSPSCDVTALHQLSLVAGVAVHDALASLEVGEGAEDGRSLLLKWPNDVLYDDAKIAGILIESAREAQRISVVIGIGVNVARAPVLEGRRTAAVGDWIAAPTVSDVMARLNPALSRWLRVWDDGRGFPEIRRAWLKRAFPPGTSVQVDTGQETFIGVYAGIDETGALLVDSVPANLDDRRRFTFGDVSTLPRKAEGLT